MAITSLSGGGLTTAFVNKRDTAGQKYLTAAPNTPSTGTAFGTWAQLTASSSADWYITGVTAQTVLAASPGPATGPLGVNIGTGGAGSETVIGDVSAPFSVNGPVMFVPFAAPILLSSGLRIAVRVALLGTGGAGTVYGWNVYLAYVPASAVG